MAKLAPAVMTTRRLSRATLLRSTALQAVVGLAVAAPALAQPAPSARPQGGQVVAGAASIGTSATATTITQSSNRAAINWQSFNVGSNQSVNFQQPSAAAVTLNRVTGGDPSAIAGKINANGQIILTNPSGVTFYQGAEVNAQSVVVSAAGITNQNFMAGKMVFDQAANPNARVENRGTITVKQAGLAALVAPSVANSGVINAKLGQVVLAGAAAQTLDMYGDGLVSIDVTKQVTQAPVGPHGKMVTALVTNTGTIRADGGVVQLTATAADGVVQTLVRAGGTIRADSVGDRAGRIEIAGTGGSVVVEGRVAADGQAPGTTGGQVMIAGSDTTTLAPTAHVTASGRAGGGTVALGTTLARAQGSGTAPTGTSARTIVASGARVAADATDRGNGGRVTVLSTQQSKVDGALTARGGKASGDGGTIEMSGELGFTFTGSADTSAPHGALGTIVIDPRDLTITSTPNGTTNAAPGTTNPTVAYADGGTTTDAYVTPTQLQTGTTGNILLQASRDLVVASSVSYANGNVELDAGRNLTVNSGVTLAVTGGSFSLNAANPASSLYDPTGALTISGTVSAANSGTLSAGTGGIAIANSVTAPLSLLLITSGAVTQTGGVVSTGDLYGRAASVSLLGANAVTGITVYGGNFVTTSGGFSLTTNSALAVGPNNGTLATGSVTVPSGQAITLGADTIAIQNGSNPAGSATLSAPGGTVAFQPYTTGRGITLTSSTTAPTGVLGLTTGELALVSASTLQLGTTTTGPVVLGQAGETINLQTNGGFATLAVTSGNAVSQGGPLVVNNVSGSAQSINLSNASNQVSSIGNLSTTSTLSLATTGPLTVNGSVGAAQVVTLTAGGLLTVATTGQIVAQTVTLSGDVAAPTGGAGTGNDLVVAGSVSASGSMVLNAGGGGIGLSGSANANTSLAVNTTGALTQTAGSVTTSDLEGTAGSVSLTSRTNAISAVGRSGVFNVTNGDFTLVAGSALTVGALTSTMSGGISVPTGDHSITLATDTLTINQQTNAATLKAPGGTLALTPYTVGNGILLTNTTPPSPPGGLVITTAELASATEGTLQLGAAVGSTGLPTGMVTVGSGTETINLGSAGFNNTGPTTLAFQTAGLVTQDTGGELAVGAVSGQAGTLSLLATNNFIGTLAGFTTTAGDLAFHTGSGLTVSADVTANGGTGNLTLSSAAQDGNLTASGGRPIGMQLNGNLSGATVSLNSLPSSGAPTSLDYGIQETGTITATTLTGAAGFAILNVSGNSIANLGDFEAYEELTIGTAGAINVTGTLKSDTYAVTLNGAGITQTASSSINTPELDGTSSADTVLTSRNNVIGGMGYFNQTAGNLSVTTSSSSFTFGSNSGLVQATNGSLTFVTDAATLAPSPAGGTALSAPNGSVSFAPFTAGRRIELIGTSAADTQSLSINSALVGDIAALRLDLGDANSTGTINIGNPGETIALVGHVGTLQLRTTGAVTQGVGGPSMSGGVALLDVNNLTGSTGSITLASPGNQIAEIGFGDGIAGEVDGLQATGSINVQSASNLSVANVVSGDATNGTVTIGTSASMTVLATLSAQTVNLSAGTGTLTQTAGSISAGGTLSLNAGTLASQTGGTITAATLTGVAGELTLGQPGNAIQAVSAYTASGGFALTNAQALTVTGPVYASTSPLSLAVTGDLALNGSVTGGPVSLVSSGAITEGPGGQIGATTLSGSANTAALGSSNLVGTLGSFATTAGFSLVNGQPLTVGGPVTDGQSVTVSATGLLTMSGSVTAPVVTLTSASGPSVTGGITQTAGLITGSTSVSLTSDGAISQSGGSITAGTLTGSSDDATSLTSASNLVTTLGSFTADGAFSLTNAQSLSQSDLLDAFSVALSVTGDLALNGLVLSGPVSLVASGAITQGSGGQIDASTLGGSANSANLGNTNFIDTLGSFATTAGFSLVNGQPLTVSGPVTDGQSIAISTTGPLTVSGQVTAPVVTLVSSDSNDSDEGSSQPGQIIQTAGTVSGSSLVSLTSSGTISQSGGSITAGTLSGSSVGTTSLVSADNAVTALGSFSSSGGFSLANGQALTVTGPVTDGTSVTLSTTGALTLAGTVQTGALSLMSSGAITQPGGSVTATTVSGNAASAALGSSGNVVDTLAGFTTSGAFALTNGQALTVTGPVYASASPLSLAVTGDLALNGSVTGGPVSLVSSGAITEGSGGQIGATTLSGSANSAVLGSSNLVGTLGGFTTTAGFSLVNGQPLTVFGPVTDGQSVTVSTTGLLTMTGIVTAPVVTLTSASGPSVTGGIDQTAGAITGSNSVSLTADGAISQSGGSIVTPTLSGSADSAALGGMNLVGTLGEFVTSGAFALTNAQALTVTGPVYASASPLSLAVTGDLALDGSVTGGPVSLVSSGAITEGSGGQIGATTLSGSANTAALGSSNLVGTLGSFATTAGFSLVNGQPLTVGGPVTAGQSIAISTAGVLTVSGGMTAPVVTLTSVNGPSVTGGITQTAGVITGSTLVSLASSGTISQSGGSITAGTLSGSSVGTTSLVSADNAVTTLGSFSSLGGFSLTNGQALTVTGPVTDGTSVTLATTSALTLAGTVQTGALSLTSSGAITQPGGSVTATTVSGNAASAALGSSGNVVDTLAGFTTSGAFALTDSQALTVTGPVYASASPLSLAVTGDLALNGSVTGGPVSLVSSGAITEGSGGQIGATTLSGSANSAVLGSSNLVGTLGGFTTTAGFSLVNGQPLTVFGPVTDGQSVTVSTTGLLTMTGSVTAPVVTLTSANGPSVTGGIDQTAGAITGSNSVLLTADGAISQSGGSIVTPTLSGSADSAALGGMNLVGTLGEFVTSGAFALTNAQALTVTGPVYASASPLSLAVTGDLALDGSVTGGPVSLVSSGAITEGSGGQIGATTLSGSANTAALGSSNLVGTLGSFATTAGFSLVNGQPLTVGGPVTAGQSVVISTAGVLTVSGGLTAPMVTLVSSDSPGTDEGPAQPGGIVQTAGTVSGSSSVSLTSSGTISQSGGVIATAVLSGSSVGTTDLGSSNAVATLGSFSSSGGFSLTNGQALTVSGPVTDSTSVTLATTSALTLAGTVQTGALSLTASGAITQPGGNLVAGSLSGSGAGVALTQRSNQVGTLDGFASTVDFALTDSVALTVSGAVSAGSGRTLTVMDDTPMFGAGGSLSAPNGTVVLQEYTPGKGLTVAAAGGLSGTPPITATTLVVGAPTGGPITIAGAFNLPTVSVLDLESAGAISETGAGAIDVGTLTGHGASASLGGSNQLGDLGAFTTTGAFTLTDAQSLTVSGPVTASSASLSVSGDLSLAGSISAPTSVSLVASGAITQSAGGIATAALSGSANSAMLGSSGNAVATLGGFSSSGGFSLADGQALTVSGPVTDGTRVAFNVSGGLSLAGTVQTGVLSLTASGAITQPGGSLVASSLSGSGAGVALTQRSNQVGRLNGFASTADFALTDSIALTVSGAVSAGSGQTLALVDDAPTFGTGGSLAAPNGTVALMEYTAGKGITIAGGGSLTGTPPVTAATLVVGAPTGGPITIAGAFDLSTVSVLDLESGGAISETGAGAIRVGTLTGHGASASLGGSNQLGGLGAFTTAGAFTLTDAQSLTVSGPVTASSASFSVAGDLALLGTISAPTSVSLVASGAITQPSGGIATAALSGSATSAILGSNGNAVATLAGFTTTGDFTLFDGRSLTVTAPVDPNTVTLSVLGDLTLDSTVTGGIVVLTATGAITGGTGGQLTATTLSGSAGTVSLGGANAIGTLGGFQTTGGFSLANAQPLSVTGTVSDSRALTLSAVGGVTLAGTISAPTITVTANTGAIQQTGGAITATSAVGLNASGAITQTGGSLVVGSTGAPGGLALMAGGPITIGGSVTTGGLSITTPGSLTQTGGSLTATAFSGSMGGPVTLGTAGVTVIPAIADLVSNSGIILVDSGPLQLAGLLAAPNLGVTSVGVLATNGGVIQTNANDPSSYLRVLAGPDGTATLRQTGITTVLPFSGSASALSFDLPASGGVLSFNALSADNSNIVLSLGTGTGTGTLDAKSLTVLATGGRADFAGQVSGQSDFEAAQVSQISPAVDNAYTLNGCAIASTACSPQSFFLTSVLDAVSQVASVLRPDILTLDVLDLSVTRDQDDPTLLLPNISDRDY